MIEPTHNDEDHNPGHWTPDDYEKYILSQHNPYDAEARDKYKPQYANQKPESKPAAPKLPAVKNPYRTYHTWFYNLSDLLQPIPWKYQQN